MKALVVYYSFEGNTEYMAKRIASNLDADIEAIRPVSKDDEPPHSGFMKFLKGGFSAIRGEQIDIRSLSVSVTDYDTIILCSPVWASSYPPAVVSFIERYSFSGKDLYVAATSGSGNAKKMFKKISRQLPGNHYKMSLSIKSPVSGNSDEESKIDRFCSVIRG